MLKTKTRVAEPRFHDPIEGMARRELEALQQRRLLEQVAYVHERSPLVRDTWAKAGIAASDIRSTADFKRLVPFIDKDTLRHYRDTHDDATGGVLCVDPSELTLIGTSSGTTGDPTVFGERWTDPGDWIWTPREMWELGLRPGDYVADIDAVLRSVGHLCFRDAGAIPIFFNHDASDLPRFVEWSLKYRPTFMFLLSSVLIYGLARLEAERGIDMRDVFSSYRCLAYGGEPMGRQARELMERWQAPVYQFSSLGDCGTGWECRARDGFHAWEDLVLFEVVNPLTGEPTPDGERGEMVITSLVDRTDPLIRFRSGDLVRWTAAPCSCGRTHARYWPLGRVSDETIVAGKSVMPRDIWSAIEETPATAAGMFQIIRAERETDSLRLRVGYDGAPDLAALADTVARAVEGATGVRPEIQLVPTSEIVKLGPPHKIPRTAKN